MEPSWAGKLFQPDCESEPRTACLEEEALEVQRGESQGQRMPHSTAHTWKRKLQRRSQGESQGLRMPPLHSPHHDGSAGFSGSQPNDKTRSRGLKLNFPLKQKQLPGELSLLPSDSKHGGKTHILGN